jgi:hypothetical protein
MHAWWAQWQQVAAQMLRRWLPASECSTRDVEGDLRHLALHWLSSTFDHGAAQATAGRPQIQLDPSQMVSVCGDGYQTMG